MKANGTPLSFALRWFWLEHKCRFCRRNYFMPQFDKMGMREGWEQDKNGKWHYRLMFP